MDLDVDLSMGDAGLRVKLVLVDKDSFEDPKNVDVDP